MKAEMEISTNMYCSANDYENSRCFFNGKCPICRCFHRKWPTPEQFKEEYGKEWTGAVYVLFVGEKMTQETPHSKLQFEPDVRWLVTVPINAFKKINGQPAYDAVVCACTPWGVPPNDWRPE